MNKILTHDYGKSFPPAMSFAGYIFAVAGIIASVNNVFLGALFIIAGIFIAFSRSGIQIDLSNKTYRSYNHLFGIKQGKWKNLEHFAYITLLRNKEGTSALSRSNRRAVTSSNLYYEITLLNSTHREKRSIKRFKNKEEALESLKELSELLNLPVSKFDPHKAVRKRKA